VSRPPVGARALVPVVLLVAVAGCHGSLAAGGGMRLEHAASPGDARAPRAVRFAPEATWRSAAGEWTAAASYAPLLTWDGSGAALFRHRLAAEGGGGREAGLRPYGGALVEYGEVPAAELWAGGEDGALVPTPQLRTLSSYAIRGEGGLRGHLSRRTRLRVGAGFERSAGTGAAAAVLPELTRVRVHVGAQHQVTRADRVEAGLKVSHFAMDGSQRLAELDVRGVRQLAPRLTASATVGGALASGADGADAVARPVIGAGVAYLAPRGGPSLQLAALAGPEFDRLDGGLRQRVQARAALELPVAATTRAGATLQWAGDLRGDGEPRRILSFGATLRSDLPGAWGLELGLRSRLQELGSHGRPLAGPTDGDRPPGAELRLHAGVSRRVGRR
jgi:hypothetical protein